MKKDVYKPYLAAHLTYESRREAEKVISCLRTIINTYGFATVADLRDLMDEDEGDYRANKFGWTGSNFKNPHIYRRSGDLSGRPYRIDFATPIPVDNMMDIKKDIKKDLKEETVVEIESLLMGSNLNWLIKYDPASGSYHIDID